MVIYYSTRPQAKDKNTMMRGLTLALGSWPYLTAKDYGLALVESTTERGQTLGPLDLNVTGAQIFKGPDGNGG